jgi:hypothetical protein
MQSPSKQVQNGQFIKIPNIQGHNDDEGSLFTLSTNCNSDADTKSYIISIAPFNFPFPHPVVVS